MTLHSAMRLARARQLRPEGYQRFAGGVIALLYLVVLIQVGANIYIGEFISRPVHGSTEAELAVARGIAREANQANLAWCTLFLATVSPIVAYRGVARFARNVRLRLLPVRPGHLPVTAMVSAVAGIPVLSPLLVGVVSTILATTTAGSSPVADYAVVMAVGGIGFAALFIWAWSLDVAPEHLELIEVGMLVLMILANPVFRVRGGGLVVLFFNRFALAGRSFALSLLVPLGGTGAVAVALTISLLFTPFARPHRRRNIGLTLYLHRLPVGFMVVSFAIELPVILLSAVSTSRVFIVVFLGVRVLWFFSFLFRAEQDIGTVIRAATASRGGVYRIPAALHVLLCLISPVAFIIRVL